MGRETPATARELLAASFSGMVFGFLEDCDEFPENYGSSTEGCQENEAYLLDEEEEAGDQKKDMRFWDNQHQLLQATLRRTSSLETRIRSLTREVVKEIQQSGMECGCGKTMAGGCQSCLLREVSGRLCNAGHNSAICKSKWRSSPDIPSGEHAFLDVVDNSRLKKGEVRVIIELNFRAEFEMARAGDQYNNLVQKLPEVFVGKVERLQSLIKILCSAAKKCMKEKKMHMGPWRKQKYMQAKWLSPCKRTTLTPVLAVGDSSRLRPKPKESMLTVDLLEMMPNRHCMTAVQVV
ncbi:uncharacterized protein LOC103938440 [Pyrus x bretschneideri]|uniref:uncharacterized protein LOC103938440 n=1 Tax=Pyrus x bretschneideri TaxID=225117 RepID=UPI00203035F7|nr:uncharacterized protein LOC103938440 [Pyrus x bretschneideri]